MNRRLPTDQVSTHILDGSYGHASSDVMGSAIQQPAVISVALVASTFAIPVLLGSDRSTKQHSQSKHELHRLAASILNQYQRQ